MVSNRSIAPCSSAQPTSQREITALNLVRKSREGDKEAVIALVTSIQDRVYGLAVRMLWHPADAEDATQEILVRIITHLGSFREECAFDTWVYRVACNYLLTTRKRRAEQKEVTFEHFEEMLERGLAAEWPASQSFAEQGLVVEETMRDCIQALLLCLNRDLRMAYILGELFEVPGAEAAQALDITPIAFRKRLSRARTLLRSFMQGKCGLVNRNNPCRCEKQAAYAVRRARGNPEELRSAARSGPTVERGASLDRVRALDELHRVAAVFRSLPDYRAPDMPGRVFDEIIESAKLWLSQPEE